VADEDRSLIVADWPTSTIGEVPLPTPAAWLNPAALINGVAHLDEPAAEQTVIIGPRLARRWKLGPAPTRRGEWPYPVPSWVHGAPGPWVTFSRGGTHRVFLGIWPWLRQDRYPDRSWPLLAGLLTEEPDPAAVVARFEVWRRTVGIPYRGTPGVAGMALLRHVHAHDRPPGPLWRTSRLPELERAYEAELSWTSPLPARGAYRHTYDRRMAYLAAASTVELAAGPLQATGSRYEPSRAGWWLIDADPWTHPQMPDPLEGMWSLSGLWVTTPTLRLLHDLREQGWYGGFRIRSSWTGPQSRVLRGWAERLRDAIAAASANPGPDGQALTAALKAAYRQAYGLMAREGGAVYRPDWHHAILAQSRVTVWRAAWQLGQQYGTWPAGIHVDAITYGSDEPDAEQANPGFRLADRLGGWRIHRTAPTTRTEARRGHPART